MSKTTLDLLANLSEIADEMKSQDNAMTQNPIWIVVETTKEYVAYEWDWDGKERPDPDYMDNDFESGLCETCRTKWNDEEDIPDNCNNCDYDTFVYFKINNEVPNLRAGMFLTRKACLNHIEANSYHYNNGRPYAIAIWRNPEMMAVLNMVLNSTERPYPTFYDKKYSS